jgi:hypothetical protein
VAEKRPDPTLREIIDTIRRIVHGAPEPTGQPRRGLSPGLLLMAVVAVVISFAALVKILQQN